MAVHNKKPIYLDYASSTGISAASLRAMRAAETLVGNPNAIHSEGVKAKRELEKARSAIAAELGCKSREIIFTSGITESNNLAILGLAYDFFQGESLDYPRTPLGRDSLIGTHWIVSALEHASVSEPFNHIEELGGIVSRIAPNSKGIISPESVQSVLRKETVCVSVGWANNEIGIIQPLGAIGHALREHEEKFKTKIIFHTDAGQGPLYLPSQVHSLRVDLFSFGSSKIYVPHGIGALYISNRVDLEPIILGGGQERGLRAGTENVALAAGFAAALSEAAMKRERESKRDQKLRDNLAEELIEIIPGAVVNGDTKRALPHMLNISIPDIQSEYLMLALDRAGVEVSTKSACDEGEAKESHVVAALGGEAWRAHSSLRFSIGEDTTSADIRQVVSTLYRIINKSM